MKKGWKPLPVVFKIIFIILAMRAFFSIASLAPSFNQGFDFFGFTFYGLYAINLIFVIKTLLPAVLLVCMFQRYRHTWMAAAGYFFVMALSIFFTLRNAPEMLQRVMEQMPGMFHVPDGLDEYEFQKMLMLSLKGSVIFSALFELAIMVIFLARRKYFSVEEKSSGEELSS
ncbi:MAG TPA: hypothetical protein PKW80_15185 [Bacteroidales bacterium]|nr:hypothetical protein [Bacteroidales bacterium]